MEVLPAPLLRDRFHTSSALYRAALRPNWAHLDGSISLPEEVPTSIAAVHTAQSHEKAEREEVPMVIVAHTVV